jgi:hypothetical protein
VEFLRYDPRRKRSIALICGSRYCVPYTASGGIRQISGKFR